MLFDRDFNPEDHAVPHDVALFVKRYYEEELFEIENLSHLTIKPVLDENGNATKQYVIEAGVYDEEIQNRVESSSYQNQNVNKGNVAEFTKNELVPTFLEIPGVVDEKYQIDIPNSIYNPTLKSFDGFPLNEEIKAIKRVPIKIVKGSKFYGLSTQTKHTTLKGGISVNHYKRARFGTLGAIVNLQNDPNDYIISNWHVLSTYGAKLNDSVLQPAPLDGGRTSNDNVAELAWYRLSEQMDVALAKIKQGQLHQKQNYCGNSIQGSQPAVINMNIYKCGRTTKHQKGTVNDIHFSTNVFHRDYPNGKLYFKEQILLDCYSQEGDSGSLVIEQTTDLAIGLLFAGDKKNKTLANPLDFNLPSNNIIHESHNQKIINLIF